MAGLIAHTMVAHFVDHLPYYRLEQINAHSGVHPRARRSALASWSWSWSGSGSGSGSGDASLMPLHEAHRAFALSAPVLHADETPVKILAPGTGKMAKAYVWAYASGEHDGMPGVIYDFCTGRGRSTRHSSCPSGRARPPVTIQTALMRSKRACMITSTTTTTSASSSGYRASAWWSTG